MRKTYRILAWIVAAEVVVQAIAIAWFLAGLGHWVTGGGVLDSAAMESDEIAFTELYGHNLKHAKEGLVVHLMYDGVSTPYAIGKNNEPE